MKVLLASASPRRRELLKKIFSSFDAVSPDVDETQECNDPYTETVRLALKKARASYNADYDLIISSDTIVYCNDKFYGKPHNFLTAKRYLEELSAKTHLVVTGVAIKTKSAEYTFFDKSEVTFNSLSKRQIEEYITKCEPYDKAGAYGIQDNAIVDSYVGSYDNIVGLPTEKLISFLRDNCMI